MGLLDRWKRRWRTAEATPPMAPSPIEPAAPKPIEVNLHAVMRRDFPVDYPIAAETAAQVMRLLPAADLSPLARRSPSLRGYNWSSYLECSICRVVRFLSALRTNAAPNARILDFGSYFGNFALAAQVSGFRVDAIDAYATYDGALSPWVELQRSAGVTVHDFDRIGYGLQGFAEPAFDAVICAGVIEHMAHTPRPLLETINAVLKPGGVLILDTPNLGYLYKRLALLEGKTIFAPIEQQYFTDIPFEGHHREYTVGEIEWLIEAIGHRQLVLETFNYSMFGAAPPAGEHVDYFHAMTNDPLLREVIFSVSQRPS